VLGLVMATSLALVSVHLRLVNSGLGCEQWPQCYGRIGDAASGAVPAHTNTDLARQTHRALASALGIVVLLAAAACLRRPGARVAAALLLLVTLGLAALGKHSAGLEQPAVVMANYSGGLLLVALFWWLLNTVTAPPSRMGRWSLLLLAALSAQLLSGGLVSAYFAGLACGPTIHCEGHWLPGLPWDVISTFFAPLTLDGTGKVIMDPSLTELHMAHRIGGMMLVAILAWFTWGQYKSGRRLLASTLLLLTGATALVGVLTVKLQLPHGMVLSHYILALALLLTTLSAVATGGTGPRNGASQR
jgi:cytochrome c oxidase assembly protein subunit 15